MVYELQISFKKNAEFVFSKKLAVLKIILFFYNYLVAEMIIWGKIYNSYQYYAATRKEGAKCLKNDETKSLKRYVR